MKYIADHDYHIHSKASLCSNDPLQTTEAILKIGKENGFKKLCLTDHYWDERIPLQAVSGFYEPQNTEHLKQTLPLPQDEETEFHFGAEIDMNLFGTIGISDKMLDELEFIIIPTTHLHMKGFTIEEKRCTTEGRAEAFCERFDKLLSMDLPFHKIGLAHITCSLIAPTWDEHLAVLNLIDDKTFSELFSKAAKVGMGVELNAEVAKYVSQGSSDGLRPYFKAKEAGCKFYFGSDAHHNQGLYDAKKKSGNNCGGSRINRGG